MRHYHPDSPEALSRIVIAALLADGGLDKAELARLRDGAIVPRLGMDGARFDLVMQQFCEDLHVTLASDHAGQLRLDRNTIDALLAEIESPRLQLQVLGMVLDLVSADDRLTPPELTLLSQAMTRWGLELHAVSAHRQPL